MAISARSIRIISASALSLVLIGGAYAVSGPIPFLTSNTANAQSTDELLKAYAAKDSDSDGLPDWQEALYGTDPNNAHSVSATFTDAEAVSKGLVTPKTSAAIPTLTQPISPADAASEVPGPNPAPGSLTDQFGQQFMQEFAAASASGQQLTADQQQTLETKLLASYSQKAGAQLVSRYTSLSLQVSQTATVPSYAQAVEQILRSNDVPADSSQPVPLMQAFLQNSDASAQKKLGVLGNSYAAIAKNLLATPVPPSLIAQHLALVQSFDTLSRATKAATNYNNDPLAVLGSLSLLQPVSQTVMDTFQSLAQAIIASDGEPQTGAPGVLIVHIARSAQQS